MAKRYCWNHPTPICVSIKKKNGQWTFSHVIDGFIAPVMHLEVDQSGVIWASHRYQGVYKIVLSDDLSAVKKRTAHLPFRLGIYHRPYPSNENARTYRLFQSQRLLYL